MTLLTLNESDKASFDGRIHTCPLRGHSTSFQLVDEFGDGKPYAGLMYEVTDYEDEVYTGTLDANGAGKVEHHYCGPVVLRLAQLYQGTEELYKDLKSRPYYHLPITELQVRAEKTRFFNKTGQRTQSNPTQSLASAGAFYQVEVSELVIHTAHLPPIVGRRFGPSPFVFSLFRKESKVRNDKRKTTAPNTDSATAELGYAPKPTPPDVCGIALLPNKHHVLEVRPLRALRPMISTGSEFCTLNLYQLALMSTLSYSNFDQLPNAHPVEASSVSFPLQPSSGNWFGDALPKFAELWQVDRAQAGGKAYYPLYEEVPYSKRLEVVPFDPDLYRDVNAPSLEKQETPASLHFFDDTGKGDDTNTQAYITHHDELILIAVRGTAEVPDIGRDANAEQVLFDEGDGNSYVHNGFYGAAKAAYDFATGYLDKFYSGQKLVITGHSLGGAAALILSEMLRRRVGFTYDIVLYTYGSPRAGDQAFVNGASALTHHRTVNHNDPVPSVPATWMDTADIKYIAAKIPVIALNAPAGLSLLAADLVNFVGDPYAHHGKLYHFMPVEFSRGKQSAILWEPGCSIVNDQGCARELQAIDGLPVRGSFLRQLIDNADHKMVVSYIPHCWASLLRAQEALQANRPLITDLEIDTVSNVLDSLKLQLRNYDFRNAARASKQMATAAKTATVDKFKKEISDLEATRNRLQRKRYERVTPSHVYGVLTEQPELLAEGLDRWKNHPENNAKEQLAMAPPPVINHDEAIAAILQGREPGSAVPFDLDSFS